MSAALPPLLLIQFAVAAVWFYEGFWCKVLGRSEHEFEVVAQTPGLSRATSALLLRLLGVVETTLAVWVLSGWQPVACAIAQTVLLVGLNSGGIAFSRHLIPDPAGMVIKNTAFLVLAWVAAGLAATA